MLIKLSDQCPKGISMFDGGMGWKGVFQVFSAHVGSVILIIHHHPGVALSRDFLFAQNFFPGEFFYTKSYVTDY